MKTGPALVVVLALLVVAPHPLQAEVPTIIDGPSIVSWEAFGLDDGLPSEKVLCIRADDERVWAGTEKGLAAFEDGRWQTWSTADGLPSDVILSLDVSPRTGDLWIGTAGGLARMSAGRIDTFTQLTSGLSNDFVHAVACDPDADQVWAATAMGASRLDLNSGSWTTFTERNTPMAEPWTYSVAIDDGIVYVGAWGAGVLELDKKSGRWREYRDPDKEMEIDLLADDGPVHDVTSGVAFSEGILWQATYFGLARYDGRRWRTYLAEDSGLLSNFVQFVRADGRRAWCATDRGLSVTDGSDWVSYRRRADGRGELSYQTAAGELRAMTTPTAMPHNFVLGVDIQGDSIWVATEGGVGRGRLGKTPATPELLEDPAVVTPIVGRSSYANTPESLLPYRNLPVHHQFYSERPEFPGAGRDRAEPNVTEVAIGLIAPLERSDGAMVPVGLRATVGGESKVELFGRPMLRGARLAIEHANAEGGLDGVPFRLAIRSDLVLWGQTSNELVKFRYEDRVWAVLSGVESNHQHVLARTTLKTELPIVNAGSADPTLLEHAIPWIVRVRSDDRQIAYVLLDHLFGTRDLKRLAVLRTNDRDARVGIAELIQGARRLGRPIVIEQRFEPGAEDFSAQLRRIETAHPDGLILYGNPLELAAIVKEIRAAGSELPIFAFDKASHPAFLAAAGDAADGLVTVTSLGRSEDEPEWVEFSDRYRQRFGEEPQLYAALAYDGVMMIVKAIRSAGLNRARIRDALFSEREIEGVSGPIVFDSTQGNVTPPRLMRVEAGALVPLGEASVR